ncbi:MAG: uridine kinase [Bacteroidota bacterium]
MLGDVLLIQPFHKKLAADCVDLIGGFGDKRIVIAISGASGSGKSELAHSISLSFKTMKRPAKVLSTDDFYSSLPSERGRIREENGIENFVGPGEYSWTSIQNTLNSFRLGMPATMPIVDGHTDQVDTLQTDFSQVHVLILEGLYSIKAEDVDYRIYLERTWEDTLQAQVLRGKENLDDTRMRILQQEHKMVLSLKPLANILIERDHSIIDKR